MRLLYIADGRSPIALNWVSYFILPGHEVHLASTFPCEPVSGLASLVVIPVALSGIYSQSEVRGGEYGKLLRKVVPVGLRTRFRTLLAPMTFTQATDSLRDVVERIQPDLIHAMRIPFEGMIASLAVGRSNLRGNHLKKYPLLISVWGNDFTLHAKTTPVMDRYTRQTLDNCDALHTDCQRDINLAREMGFSPTKPYIVLPGGGGVKMDIFFPPEKEPEDGSNQVKLGNLPVTIINPRGFRAYVRNDTFFHAIPLVLEKYPYVRFICPGMVGESQARKWMAELGIGEKVELLPSQPQQGMAELFRQSQISLSITTHDGTPNTLLEAMACGCFPIAGNIESLREWITHGENGLLLDPGDPIALADAIIKAISQPELRIRAREKNLLLVKKQAEHMQVMQKAEDFYRLLIAEM